MATAPMSCVGLDVVVDALDPHVRRYRTLGLEVDVRAAEDVAVVGLGALRLVLAGPASSDAAPGVVALRLDSGTVARPIEAVRPYAVAS